MMSFSEFANLADRRGISFKTDEDEQKAYTELISYLERLKKDIPKALQDLRKENISNHVVGLVGRLIRSQDEDWYTYFWR